MNASALQLAQADVIRMVQATTDIHVLDRIKSFLTLGKAYSLPEEEPVMAKDEIVENLKQGFREAKLWREGKIEGISVEELMDELRS